MEQKREPIPYVMQGNNISLVLDNTQYIINKDSHAKYAKILAAIKSEQWDEVAGYIDITKALLEFSEGLVAIKSGEIFYKDKVFHNALSTRLLKMHEEGFPITPMIKFLENLKMNPSKRAVDELYGFLENNQLPITPDGHFLAYKNVDKDYKDIHSGTFDNRIGQKPEMERNEVDDDQNNVCSQGLHFCSREYLPSFNKTDGHTMVLKINPRDVVSIPVDYNNSKGRCCLYEVVGELNKPNEPENFEDEAVKDLS